MNRKVMNVYKELIAEEASYAAVGQRYIYKQMVTEITYSEEGNYVDVHMEDGTMERIFRPDTILFAKEEQV